MTPEQFTQCQIELGYDNHRMGLEINLSERMVAYMKAGEKRIMPQTVLAVKDALARKIAELKLLHKSIAKVR